MTKVRGGTFGTVDSIVVNFGGSAFEVLLNTDRIVFRGAAEALGDVRRLMGSPVAVIIRYHLGEERPSEETDRQADARLGMEMVGRRWEHYPAWGYSPDRSCEGPAAAGLACSAGTAPRAGWSGRIDAMELIGVDGCRGGWVVARSDDSGRPPTFAVEPSFRSIVDSARAGRALIVVDIPIGLPSGRPIDDGSRACDRAAREFLGPGRAVSVFSAPCRAALEAESYAQACAIQAAARGRGKGLSRQAYGILPKIREVDLVITPALQEWVREAHPEVTFAALSGGGSSGHGLAHAKKRCRACRRGGTACTGEADRLRLLHDYFPELDPAAEHARLDSSSVGRDDILDAAACFLSARRAATDRALVLPRGETRYDARGLRMEIIA